jgi:hypothetical protein
VFRRFADFHALDFHAAEGTEPRKYPGIVQSFPMRQLA